MNLTISEFLLVFLNCGTIKHKRAHACNVLIFIMLCLLYYILYLNALAVAFGNASTEILSIEIYILLYIISAADITADLESKRYLI